MVPEVWCATDRQMDGQTDGQMENEKPTEKPTFMVGAPCKNSKRKTGEEEIYCKSLGNLILKSSGIITGFPMNFKPLSLKSWKNTYRYLQTSDIVPYRPI